MKPQLCACETDLWAAMTAGDWPDAVDPELRAHVSECAICRDVEVVAESLCMEAAAVRDEAAPPSSAIVWWRAQMRARQEAATRADTPITIVQALAIACAAGLALGLVGTVMAWVRGTAGWLGDWNSRAANVAAVLGAIDFTSRWVVVPAILIALSVVIMPIAFYVIVSDD